MSSTNLAAAAARANEARGTRFPCFDGYRALAAIAVLLTHVSFASQANRMWGGEFLARMDAGVAIFFVISGFLLYRPFVGAHLAGRPQPTLLRYFWRRLLRIYPAYWIAVTAIVYVAGAYTIHSAKDFILLYGLLHIYSTRLVLHAPVLQAWTLGIEISFYVFLPLYATVIARIGRGVKNRLRVELLGVAALVLVSFAWRFAVLSRSHPSSGPYLSWLPNWLDLFAAGMFLAVVSAWLAEHRRPAPLWLEGRWAPAASWGLAAFTFWLVSTQVGLSRAGFLQSSPSEVWNEHLLYGLTAVFLLLPGIFGPQDQGRIRAILQRRTVVAMGLVSYGLYLWHEFWIGQFLSWKHQLVVGNTDFLQMLAVVSALTAATAALSYLLIERPALSLKNWTPRWLPPLVAAIGSPPPTPEASSPRDPPTTSPTRAPGSPRAPPEPTPDDLPRWAARRFSARLVLIALGALAVRVVYVLTIATTTPHFGDAAYYHVQANLLAAGKGFAEPFTFLATHRIVPSATHPPLYSLVLSVPSLVGVDSVLVHKLLSCLIGATVVFVAGLLGRRVGGERVGLLTAGIAAVYPNLWVIDGILLPEGLFALIVALAVLAAYRLDDSPSVRRAGLLGALIGLAALTRGEGVFLLILLAAPLVLRRRERSVRERATLLATAGFAALLVLSPWLIRNETSFERRVFLSTDSGDVLAQTNCDDTYYRTIGYWSFPCGNVVGNQGDESVRSAKRLDIAIDYIRAHKSRLPVVAVARIGRVWDLYNPLQNAELAQIEGRDLWVARTGLATYALLVPLALAGGLIVRRRRMARMLPLIAPFVLVTVTAMTAYGEIRFRAAAEIPIVVLAAVTINAATINVMLRRSAKPTAV